MIRIADVRKRAVEAIPDVAFQPHGDSPTIKSYTDWNVFNEAMSLPVSSGSVSGASPTDVLASFSFDPSANRMLAYHFANLPSFFMSDSDHIVLASNGDAFSLQHVLICAREKRTVRIDDIAENGPKSTTIDVLVRPDVSVSILLRVSGNHPQHLHVRYHLGNGSSLDVSSVVIGQNAHVHHEFFVNGSGASVTYRGASIRGRSDVITDVFISGDSDFARVSHGLFSAESDFLVHRGVIRVERRSSGADVDMDSAFYTTGGLAVNVPMLEVLTSDVTRASHRARDLALDEDRMFYLRTRGLSPASAEELYVSSIMRRFAGDLAEEEFVQRAIKSFAESLPR